ncbi:cysteine desulfurase [Butyrivibrio hungatei DSM 14810]|uniref:Cysteine desulfurase n=2 Tax=Butyrivibrio hungatei TaxID=185008 RepID=A0A1D9P4I2_9FIRM|nr:cysteine desulfurase family protein [Butyrivibrio hungatei]AOZ97516.1 cysteine desulfurase [Butyrivibrio hungatei]SHN62594.1 cysteine desulfurase [Butyrivibrio hungatei DSM 14810]
MEAYLDNSATTRAYDEVASLVAKIMTEEYGNPSSVHHMGMVSGERLAQARETIAATLKVEPQEILFTSGGTESDNLALIGVAKANKWRGKHIITTAIEHPAILETTSALEKEGFEITYLPVDETGVVQLEDLKAALREDTILVSMMFVNNEIGSVQKIQEAGELIKAYNSDIYFHVDAVQGYGKFVIRPKSMKIDLLSVSGHKIHGPKGIGFLYIKKGTKINPICYGGGQQKGMRSGTENVPGIAGLALAAKMCYENFEDKQSKLYELKEYLINSLNERLSDIKVNGPACREGAPHIVSVSIKGLAAETVLNMLSSKNIYVSAGSACTSNNPHISDTLQAIGLEKDLLESTIRISMSFMTTKEEIDYFLDTLCSQVENMRKFYRH